MRVEFKDIVAYRKIYKELEEKLWDLEFYSSKGYWEDVKRTFEDIKYLAEQGEEI